MFASIRNNINIFVIDKYKMYIEGILTLLYCIAILATTIITIEDKNKKFRMLFEIVSIVIITGPLFIVTPIGPRCFFPVYILLVMLAIEMVDYLTIDKKININHLLITATFILMLFYLVTFGYVFKIETIRNNYIEQNKENAKVLYLPELLFSQYLHCANPVNKSFENKFKSFYKIDNKIELVFMNYGEWKEKVNN